MEDIQQEFLVIKSLRDNIKNGNDFHLKGNINFLRNKIISKDLIGVESKRIYFNCITGGIVPEGVNEEDMYELDEDDKIEEKESDIDQYTDVCEKDKLFMKIWNRFIREKENYVSQVAKYTLDFAEEYFQNIIENHLTEAYLLHLILLFDYGQMDKKELLNSVEKMLFLIDKYGKENSANNSQKPLENTNLDSANNDKDN